MQNAKFEINTNVNATYGKRPVSWQEFAEMRSSVTSLLLKHRDAKVALLNHQEGSVVHSQSKARLAWVHNELTVIADRLASELVCGVESMDHLLSKWTAHHYRPTLRGGRASPEMILADLYDHFAKVKCIDVEAYRG